MGAGFTNERAAPLRAGTARQPSHAAVVAAIHEAAFTLIEMMVVLALIGILTAMILPEMRGTYEDALLRSAGRDLVNVCRLAYSQAVVQHQPHCVRIDRKTGRYVVERVVRDATGGEQFVPRRDLPGGEGALDQRIAVQVRKAGEKAAATASPGSRFVSGADLVFGRRDAELMFYPDGTAEAAEIVLRDPDGFRLGLTINPVTARVRVVTLRRE